MLYFALNTVKNFKAVNPLLQIHDHKTKSRNSRYEVMP